jgi:alpha-mannosidase
LGYGFNIEPVVVPVRSGRNEGVGCGWWDVLEQAPVDVPNTFCTISGEGVIGTVLKQAHDGNGIILRLFESLGQQTEARVTLSNAVLSAISCDLLERNAGEGPCSVDGQNPPQLTDAQIVVVLNPFEIKTLRVEVKNLSSS